jgi:hypothetical protein
VSKRGRALAADYVSAILRSTGVTKAAGPVSPALLMGAVEPLAEAIVQRDRKLATYRRHMRKVNKAIKANQRVLDAILAPAVTAQPSPMRLPPARPKPQQVDLNPAEWRTVLERADVPLRNGAHHAAEAAEYSPEIPPGHPG